MDKSRSNQFRLGADGISRLLTVEEFNNRHKPNLDPKEYELSDYFKEEAYEYQDFYDSLKEWKKRWFEYNALNTRIVDSWNYYRGGYNFKVYKEEEKKHNKLKRRNEKNIYCFYRWWTIRYWWFYIKFRWIKKGE